ncbi:MFS transporter [Aneurinibacillus sp. Ricciae_BoGa-3]|uniref:MFS transporter n=1 Tax=Aneurinibacillus sp. Ricciae_BoGa-3 TaxID=3022697 RepID=UPI00234249A3|nr:MFS transporter [Aneurinibacillus sp. Ricciae_BoGa-3]WCK52344.1 MFS transporter [Aneurinibacillus sp. Ricciae_BoGa-3]
MKDSDGAKLRSNWTPYQWSIVLLLLLGLILSAVDRVNISVTISYWIKNKTMTAAEAGLIQSIFGWSIIFFLLFAGPIVDKFHPRKVLPLGVVLWSIATFISGFTTKFSVLAGSRALLGLGESTLLPSAPKLIVENIQDKDRSKAISLYYSGNKIGPTVGIPLASFLLVAYGWQMVFYITGVIGLVWVGLWFAIYRKNKGIEVSETPSANPSGKVKWSKLFAYRNTWALILGQFGYLYVFYVFVTWLPGYLVLQHHISIGNSGSLGSLPFIIAIVTTLLGGWVADKWIMKTQNKTLVRKTIIGGGMALSTIFIIIAAYAQAIVPAIIFLSLTMAAMGLVTGSVNALPMDLAPREIVSSLSSLQNFGGNLGAAVAPLVTGILYNVTKSFEIPLIITGLIALIFGVGSYLLILTKVEKSYGSIKTDDVDGYTIKTEVTG